MNKKLLSFFYISNVRSTFLKTALRQPNNAWAIGILNTSFVLKDEVFWTFFDNLLPESQCQSKTFSDKGHFTCLMIKV